MKCLRAFLILTLMLSEAGAQTCGYSPEAYSPAYNIWYQNACNDLRENSKRSKTTYDTVIRIPVVFHVIYPNFNEVSYEDVLWMLNELNNDFRRKNADTIRTRDIFSDRVTDTRIEFYMADKDPQGNKCSGYESRMSNNYYGVPSNQPFSKWHTMKFDSLKGFDAWDTKHYLNIWVCNLVAYDNKQYLAAFSTAPPGAPNWKSVFWGDSLVDGVVMHYSYFRSRYYSSTLTHEVGHYLGLKHVSGDPVAINPDTCLYDDGIFDTPQINGANYYTCDFSINSCIDKVNDLPDMLENFMDYSDDQCRNSFTRQQSELMHKCLFDLRPGLFINNINAHRVDSLIYFAVQPNPNSGSFAINNKNDETFTARLYNFNGQFMGTLTIHNGINDYDLQLPSGTYYVAVYGRNNAFVLTKTLVIYR